MQLQSASKKSFIKKNYFTNVYVRFWLSFFQQPVNQDRVLHSGITTATHVADQTATAQQLTRRHGDSSIRTNGPDNLSNLSGPV